MIFLAFLALRACSVSVVASGVFVSRRQIIFVSSKAVWRGPGSSKLMYFWKNGLLEMYLGVFGVFRIINCYLMVL